MKVTIEIDCTPEEARRVMGLPDVEQANAIYMENLAKLVNGASSMEQLQDYAKQIAPMGQIGLQFFQSLMDSGAAFAGGTGSTGRKRDKG